MSATATLPNRAPYRDTLEDMHVSLPPVATNLLQESDDLEKTIELRTTQIQEREDDEHIDS